MKKSLLLFLVFLLAGCASMPVQQKLLVSMARLDRVYIPALVFTNLQRQRESEIAMERLKREWNGFNRKYFGLEIKYGLDITDKFWKEDFEKIDGLVASAEALVKEAKLEKAHEELEEIRLLLKGIRRRNGLNYFLDGMTEFHDAMEGIISTLRGKDKLTEKDFVKLRDLFKEAQTGWAEVAKAEPDPKVFGFDDEKIEAVNKRVRYEENMLANFAAALSSKDEDKIFQAAQDLKPNFVVLYKAFGDFQPVFDRVKREKKED